MRSDGVEAEWETCECDHVQCEVYRILDFFLAEILGNPASRMLFFMLVLDSYDCCGSASWQMLA